MSKLQATQPTGPDIPSLPADRIRKFMAAYVKTASLPAAARSPKISLASHYRMLEADGGYRKAFETAQEQAVGLLEAEAFRRALNGSDELLAFLLRAWLPELYCDHTVYEHSGSVTVNEVDASDARGTVRRLVAIDREKVQ
jgi:hypothetical protein